MAALSFHTANYLFNAEQLLWSYSMHELLNSKDHGVESRCTFI